MTRIKKEHYKTIKLSISIYKKCQRWVLPPYILKLQFLSALFFERSIFIVVLLHYLREFLPLFIYKNEVGKKVIL